MARTITIAGTDRTADIKFEEFSIEQILTSQEDNCSFVLTAGSKPTAGQEIIVTDGGVKFFAGIIDQVKDDPRAPGITFYKCQARDYTYQLDKKLVVETYSNQAADLIVKDILTKYCAGFTSTNVKTGAPTVEEIVFDYKRPSECFKELTEYVGWDWYVDYNKDVWFFNPSALATPAPVAIEANTDVRKLKHDIETEGLRNRIFVRGGTMLSDNWTYEVKADGAARTWLLPHKPHNISLTVGGVAKTIGIESIDDEATKDYLMNYQEKYVRASAQTTTPAAGTTMAFTYKFDIDVITMVEDVASQGAVKAVQGGDGVYEHSIVDDSLTTIDAAEAAGNADLREHANPRVKGSFETEISGWAPGQLITINLPNRGITGTFLAQKVTITPATPTLWTHRVEYGGRLLGIADWLQALWKAQQKKKLNETALLHKFFYGAETAKVTDEVQGTLRTPPWKADISKEITFTPIAAPVATFSRPSVKYKKNGAEVASGTPSYEAGKFNNGVHMEEATQNLLSANQSSVETDLTGLYADASVGTPTFTRDTATAWHGTASAKLVSTADQGTGYMRIGTLNTKTSISASIAYTASVVGKIQAGGAREWLMNIHWYDSADNYISSVNTGKLSASSTFTRLSLSATSPSNAAKCWIDLCFYGALTNEVLWWDGAQIEQKPYVTSWHIGGGTRNADSLYYTPAYACLILWL
ncbi:MAG: hypothetical protein M1609_03665, partial [Firmicutes bacterium]|nr:hypothetical protein [Bacillota bacterium]